MYSHKEAVKYLYKTMLSEAPFFNHKNLVLHGNNASGKSRLLREILVRRTSGKKDQIYYIDAKNRSIIDPKSNGFPGNMNSVLTLSNIVDYRVKEDVFSISDVFSEEYSGGNVACGEIYFDLNNDREFSQKAEKLLGMKLSLGAQKDFSELSRLRLNGHSFNKVSTSEAARLRLLLEIDFACKQKAKVIIIDEFDEFLSESTTEEMIRMLINEYPNQRFIFVVQSLNVIIKLNGLDLALIVEENLSSSELNQIDIVDGDNIDGLSKVTRIRDMLIEKRYIEKSKLENMVDSLLTGKETTQKIANEIKEMERSNLSVKEKVLYDYVMRYIRNAD